MLSNKKKFTDFSFKLSQWAPCGFSAWTNLKEMAQKPFHYAEGAKKLLQFLSPLLQFNILISKKYFPTNTVIAFVSINCDNHAPQYDELSWWLTKRFRAYLQKIAKSFSKFLLSWYFTKTATCDGAPDHIYILSNLKVGLKQGAPI